jgi:hypothetical protein
MLHECSIRRARAQHRADHLHTLIVIDWPVAGPVDTGNRLESPHGMHAVHAVDAEKARRKLIRGQGWIPVDNHEAAWGPSCILDGPGQEIDAFGTNRADGRPMLDMRRIDSLENPVFLL